MDRAQEKLDSLLALWNEKRGKRAMPSRSDLAVSALKPWLGHLAILDLNNGKGATFRLCGTNLRDRFGGEMTGRQVEALEDGIAGQLRHAIKSFSEACEPIRTKHRDKIKEIPTIYHELCLPLADNGRQIDCILFASYAEQRK